MPTGLSYAGAGIKFNMQEEGGGPWSGILSYHPDSTAYPSLFDGDVIEMTGYIYEYRTGVANMTELFITSPINILDFGQPIPEAPEVATGDLRVPETAEQWGTCLVTVKQAEVTDVNLAFELFAIDDGSGEVKVDDDSDSLQTYYDSNPLPPVGSVAESMRGWVYHHYGSYANFDAYKLEPLYMSDILWGAGAPPVMGAVTRDIGIPMSTEAVTVSCDVTSDVGLANVKIYYTVSADGQPGEYQEVDMTNVSDDAFEGMIPAQAEGSFVNYYVKASDTAAQEATKPADLTVQNYCYIVSSEALTIADIQYTPWTLADSPLEGQKVMLTGVVTSDTASLNQFDAYSIQDATGAWNGIYISGTTQELDRGTQVEVFGTVTDYNPAWSFKWDNNTIILTDSVKVVGPVEEIAPVVVTTGELATNPEAYESVLVQIQNATLIGANQYDVSFDDGSGEVLLDADFIVDGDHFENPYFYLNQASDYVVAWGDTVKAGEVVGNISGIFTFSFGSFKIELRDAADFGAGTGVNPDFTGRVFDFALNQNYPNPFNPETRISFEIAQVENVKLAIYNVLGQQVITLTDQAYEAGRHILNWN
ncbi:T9SS type A sorting domain-containing protein, partial [bacterium]|nr:T9SS type A sorting domain-containing protein [bacterium]